PTGALTTTTPAGKVGVKKDIDRIVSAHDIPYLATACSAYPKDLFNKVEKALRIKGPKFIHILSPCPPGWRYPTEKTIEMGKLAVKTGMWLLYEKEYGKVTISGPTKAAVVKPAPLETYLSMQGRFRGIDENTVNRLKSQLERNIKRLTLEAEGVC
ncbi:MAG: pyruvate synthase subunit beta, partial [Methanoregulaceae archaeon]|nr:pyruvate synthase subunit beta [Methanoregulaceae archaeon]